MTDDRMALEALLEKASDAELLAGMLGFVANRLMALDVDRLCGAGAHERSKARGSRLDGVGRSSFYYGAMGPRARAR